MNTLKWIVSVWDDNVYFYLSKTVPVLMILAWIKNTAVIRLTHPNVQQKLSAHSAAIVWCHTSFQSNQIQSMILHPVHNLE